MTNQAEDRWVECSSCGACDWQSKLDARRLNTGALLHRRGCSAGRAAAPASTTLEAFAAGVRRTGLTLGRDSDVLAAVRAGLLSESDAMNADD